MFSLAKDEFWVNDCATITDGGVAAIPPTIPEPANAFAADMEFMYPRIFFNIA